MGRNVVSFRPAEVDATAVHVQVVGTLLANRVTADVYMIVEDATGKHLRLIGASGKYDLIEHISKAQLIDNMEPASYDAASIWYATDLVYVEPADVESAYITVRVEDPSNPGTYRWQKILPYTQMQNVVIGKSASGDPITLDSIISGDRTIVRPTVDINEAINGEIYVTDSNEIWIKGSGPVEENIMLADITNDLRDRLLKAIVVSKTPPTNFDRDTVHIQLGDDMDYALAQTAYINVVDQGKTTGLKFIKDNEGLIDTGATITNDSKTLAIDNNTTNNWGHTWLNWGVSANTKVYFELDFAQDVENLSQLIFLGEGYTQPVGMTYGSEIDSSSLIVTKDGYKFKNVDTVNTDLSFDKKTVFFMIDKAATNAKIIIGYVLSDGTLKSVYGDHTNGTPGFQMPLSRVAIGSGFSTTANLKSVVNIKYLKVRNIPGDYIAINNTLPTEKSFANIAPATNAQSVFTATSHKLSEVFDSGKLIITPRPYTDVNNLTIGELSLDIVSKKLYSRAQDNKIFPIAGEYDDIFLAHLKDSVQVTNKAVTAITAIETDMSRIYVKKGTIDTKNTALTIQGNLTVRDNSPEGDGKTYKIVLPTTITPLVQHDWVTIGSGTNRSDNLKVFLDELSDIVSNMVNKDSIYSGYNDLKGLTDTIIKSNYATQELFFKEIAEKRMRDDSLYIQTITEAGAATSGTSLQINKIFNTPEAGEIHLYKDANKQMYVVLKSVLGKTYTNYVNPVTYKLSQWRENIESVSGTTTTPGALVVTTTSTFTGQSTFSSNATFASDVTFSKNTSGINVVNTAIASTGNMSLLSYDGTQAASSVKVKLGDSSYKNNFMDLYSINRPVWKDNAGNIYPWMIPADFAKGWNFKNLLNLSAGVVDINGLNTSVAVGYYLFTQSPAQPMNTAVGYPIAGSNTGVLSVYKDTNTAAGTSNVVTQTFVVTDATGASHYYIRTYNGTNWTQWFTFANNNDLDLKYDKTGGTVSGNTYVTGTFKVDGVLTSKEVQLNKITSNPTGGYGVATNLLNTYKAGSDLTLEMGSVAINKYNVVSLSNPTWNDGTVSRKFAMTDVTDAIATNLSSNYYNKTEADTLYNKKVDTTTHNDDLAKKLNLAGGTMTGELKINTPAGTNGLSINSGALTLSTTSNFNLASKTFGTSLLFDAEPASSYSNTIRYDFINTGSKDDTMLSFSVPSSVGTSAISSSGIQFYIDKNGTTMIRSIINRSSFSTWKTVVFTDIIKDDWDGGSANVLSAERGKLLWDRNISRNRKSITTFMNTATYVFNNMLALEPGQYIINSQQELVAIGIDPIKASVDALRTGGNKYGVLTVLTERAANNDTIRHFRYTPISTDNPENNFVAYKTVNKQVDSAWVYLYDTAKYYSRAEIDAMLSNTTSSVLNKFVSPLFSFTGNPVNNSIPMKLVHTHNQESLGDDKKLWFETNIGCTASNEAKRFLINLRGFSTPGIASVADDANTNIKGGSIDIDIVGYINYSNSRPTLVQYDYFIKTPGSSVVIRNVSLSSVGKVQFCLQDVVTNQGLSFDTFMRFSSIADTTFNGAILRHKMAETGF